MEYSEVDNHDDYYSIDEDGRVHVRDERGFYIMYDAAVNDLRLYILLFLVLVHGSVATQLRCGGIFSNHMIANFFLCVTVKKFFKLAQYLAKDIYKSLVARFFVDHDVSVKY